jgi:hypothetical protein
MMVEEIEKSCAQGLKDVFTRHEIEAPELTMSGVFYPLGFPTKLRTNSEAILVAARKLWSVHEDRFDTEPILVDVHVVESEDTDCPPTPEYRVVQPLLISMADANNYSIADMEKGTTQIVVSRAAERHVMYFEYFFLVGAPMCHIATRFVTPVHSGCVSLDGRGVLLCGDSGAGKSSLSYACARAGWTYTTDDATYLMNEVNGAQSLCQAIGRQVMGNCNKVRFRPTAAELFPEIDGLAITPRAAGKPSIEMPTNGMLNLTCCPTAEIDFLVFLNRSSSGPRRLTGYAKDAARDFLKASLYGPARYRVLQHAAIERLLTAEIFELHYRDLNWAIDRLTTLVREDR